MFCFSSTYLVTKAASANCAQKMRPKDLLTQTNLAQDMTWFVNFKSEHSLKMYLSLFLPEKGMPQLSINSREYQPTAEGMYKFSKKEKKRLLNL